MVIGFIEAKKSGVENQAGEQNGAGEESDEGTRAVSVRDSDRRQEVAGASGCKRVQASVSMRKLQVQARRSCKCRRLSNSRFPSLP